MDFSRIQDFDMQLLHVFNGSENVWPDQMAMALTSGWTWIPLYIVLFVVVIRNNEMMGQIALVVGGAVLCIFLADGLVDGIIKPLAERYRPSSDPMFKYTVQVVDNMRLKSFSFCSAHAANTLSLAIFFSLLIRSKLVTWTLLLWSLVNCWTRLYLGVHYPVDILWLSELWWELSFILSTSGCITASPQRLSIFPTSIRVRVTTMMM